MIHPTEQTLLLLKDAVKQDTANQVVDLKIGDDGETATITNREGHRFSVNLAAGIDRVIANCFDNNVRLFKDYHLEQHLIEAQPEADQPTDSEGKAIAPPPEPTQQAEKPKRGRKPGRASE